MCNYDLGSENQVFLSNNSESGNYCRKFYKCRIKENPNNSFIKHLDGDQSVSVTF